MLKISAVYLIGKAEIPIHYTTWAVVEQALLMIALVSSQKSPNPNICAPSIWVSIISIPLFTKFKKIVKSSIAVVQRNQISAMGKISFIAIWRFFLVSFRKFSLKNACASKNLSNGSLKYLKTIEKLLG